MGLSRPSRSLNCNAIELFETGKAVLDFFQRRLAQVRDAVLPRGFGDLHRIAAFHDDAAEVLRDRHDLIDADAPFVAASALAAAFGAEDRDAAVDLGLGEA